MSEDDVRKYLNRKDSSPAAKPTPMVVRRGARPPAAGAPRRQAPETFKNFSATHLLCPTCRRAMSVREKLLLFLPDGDLYDYVCTKCGTSVGTRKAGR